MIAKVRILASCNPQLIKHSTFHSTCLNGSLPFARVTQSLIFCRNNRRIFFSEPISNSISAVLNYKRIIRIEQSGRITFCNKDNRTQSRRSIITMCISAIFIWGTALCKSERGYVRVRFRNLYE